MCEKEFWELAIKVFSEPVLDDIYDDGTYHCKYNNIRLWGICDLAMNVITFAKKSIFAKIDRYRAHYFPQSELDLGYLWNHKKAGFCQRVNFCKRQLEKL